MSIKDKENKQKSINIIKDLEKEFKYLNTEFRFNHPYNIDKKDIKKTISLCINKLLKLFKLWI
ncbi:hypothetical protein EOL94_04430 [bacterium]|nr:hypothetical protein [bacterium]